VSPVAAVTPPSPGRQPVTACAVTCPWPTDRSTTPIGGWHGPACTQSCWAWSRSAIAVGAGQPATPRNPGLRWGDRLLSVGPPNRTHAIGARSTIGEVRDRLRIMGGLPKIRTPGAQTGRCDRRRATITACPVGCWDRRPTRSQHDFVDRSRSAQCAQPGRVRARMRSSGVSDHRRNCHHCIKRQLPAINVRNSPRSARGAVRARNRWRAAGRAGRPRRDRSPPRGAPVETDVKTRRPRR
jgi:hypothetical protein